MICLNGAGFGSFFKMKFLVLFSENDAPVMFSRAFAALIRSVTSTDTVVLLVSTVINSIRMHTAGNFSL